MPWSHCGAEVPDTSPCPTCGITKEVWTLEFDVTPVVGQPLTERAPTRPATKPPTDVGGEEMSA